MAAEAGCAPVVVVLGYEADRMQAELEGVAIEVVVHPGWAEGMGSSLRRGVEVVRGMEAVPEAVLVLVCDQPRLSAEHLRALIERQRQSDAPITASVYAGRAGVPAIFARRVLLELAGLQGDRGARDLIRRHGEAVEAVPWPDGSVDLDVPEDLRGVE